MSNGPVFEDAFNLLCGDKIGEGIHREVFRCKLRPDLVVKVENSCIRYFANPIEMKFWNDHQHYKKVAEWLAPCDFLSPDGRLLLQRKVNPLRPGEMPARLPAFLTDIKQENFGWLDGRVVCVDYAITIPAPSIRMRKVPC